jgi:hypothetical protein
MPNLHYLPKIYDRLRNSVAGSQTNVLADDDGAAAAAPAKTFVIC